MKWNFEQIQWQSFLSKLVDWQGGAPSLSDKIGNLVCLSFKTSHTEWVGKSTDQMIEKVIRRIAASTIATLALSW